MIGKWLSKWRKGNFEKTQEIEDELTKIKEKLNAKYISFIGVSGNINGLNLIYAVDTNFDYKLFAGVFAEMFQKIDLIKKIFFKGEVNLSYINYSDKILFFRAITETVALVGVLPTNKSLKQVSEWLEKNCERIQPIFNF